MRVNVFVFLAVLGAIAASALGQRLDPDRTEHVVGERVRIAVNGAPGSGSDWVGIFRVDDPDHGSPLYWQYLQGGTTPSTSGPTEARMLFLPMSLPKGSYEARLFFEGSDTAPKATAPIVVIEEGPATPPAPQGVLTVLCFNIWVQGSAGHGGLAEVIRFIKSTRADIIGLQECNADTLNAILNGLRSDPHYADARASGATGIISRFPIVEEYTASGLRGYGVRIQLPEGIGVSGETIRMFNSHLRAYPYGPYELRDGATVDEVVVLENNTRAAEMGAVLGQLVLHRGRGSDLTTFLVGDHNCPSHLDWTQANRDQNFGEVIDWPVSQMLHTFGFVDSYRYVHPDPTTERALTWSPGYPKGNLDRGDVHDRIDMVYHRAAAGRQLIPVQAYTIDRDPWPSDHRAVVVSYIYGENSLQRAR